MANDLFQFPPLREGRPSRAANLPWWWTNFNSRPCARGDLKAYILADARYQFQFPPLREGRHDGVNISQETILISIPAPARGATFTGI